MLQIIKQTHEEKVEMYMKMDKLELIEMLIQCNLMLDSMEPKISYLNEETITKPTPQTASCDDCGGFYGHCSCTL